MAKRTEPQCCRTCAFADYLRTPTGMPQKGETVHCRFPAAHLQFRADGLIASFPDAFQHIAVRVHPHGMPMDGGQHCVGYQAAKESSDGE